MIAYVEGKLVEALPTRVVVEANGVGYEILIPVSTYEKLPPLGSTVRIHTHLSVREDAHVLYGFATAEERNLFRLLTNTVTGIGPKIALNILSSFTVEAFRLAVANGDTKTLSQIPGVGRKTAERIVVELRDKLGHLQSPEKTRQVATPIAADQRLTDAVLALVALDYKQAEAYELASRAIAKLGPSATVEQIVRECLRQR